MCIIKYPVILLTLSLNAILNLFDLKLVSLPSQTCLLPTFYYRTILCNYCAYLSVPAYLQWYDMTFLQYP